MTWILKKYSKTSVDKAGQVLLNPNSTDDEIEKAYDVVDNWRSAHSFPLHIFKKRLKLVSEKIETNPLVVRRLKRNPAIVKKLSREQTKHMNLSQMQDIGGCRSVLSSVKAVNQLCNEYYEKGKKCDLKHEFKFKKDYILNPKPDGYRSIHLVYKYKSNKTDEFNGLLIEIQLRTKLQHLWATAVETVGHFTRQALKSNEGEEEWLKFFRLVSTVFANKENSPKVPGTSGDETELYEQIRIIVNSLSVIEKISNWARVINLIDDFQKKEHLKSHFYLLDLNIDTKELRITTYKKNQEELANLEYAKAEKDANLNKLNKDIVLVEADTTKELRKAYPNYFLDTKEFLDYLDNYLKTPPKK